jgi:amidophosphoribosyltransferase
VRLKYNPLRSSIEGKRVVLVDDSIVRGSTAGPLVRLIRDAGAKEIHVRVSSPPVRHPCFMGVDLGTYEEIIGANKTVEEIRAHTGADSLAYLSHEGMMDVVRQGLAPEAGHCSACFSGVYPLEIDARAAKQSFEDIHGA